MAGGLTTQDLYAAEDQGFWGELAVKLMHPTQLLIVEAIWWIEEPLSPTLLRGASEKLFDLACPSRARRG